LISFGAALGIFLRSNILPKFLSLDYVPKTAKGECRTTSPNCKAALLLHIN
jgi:hypothetical protein